jgi:hypothetical protein
MLAGGEAWLKRVALVLRQVCPLGVVGVQLEPKDTELVTRDLDRLVVGAEPDAVAGDVVRIGVDLLRLAERRRVQRHAVEVLVDDVNDEEVPSVARDGQPGGVDEALARIGDVRKCTGNREGRRLEGQQVDGVDDVLERVRRVQPLAIGADRDVLECCGQDPAPPGRHINGPGERLAGYIDEPDVRGIAEGGDHKQHLAVRAQGHVPSPRNPHRARVSEEFECGLRFGSRRASVDLTRLRAIDEELARRRIDGEGCHRFRSGDDVRG